ncbi:MAG: adenine deaminase [Verrucomicrobia bacterium]|nr:adenine deaminase [Verrucomicrobiota bacterium]MBV8277195.1 adenine deaminase [Verrucomicrobiota bacterium]
MTRFDVPPLAQVTRHLADVSSERKAPDLVIAGGRVLSVYTERLLPERELWISRGRIAAVKPTGSCQFSEVERYDVQGGILAPGLVDPHVHIESSMMTACAYAEAALINGTTTIFCDSHEIGNVCDSDGLIWMLEDARQAPLNIFLTLPSTIPATHPGLETAGGDLTPAKVGAIFDEWPEAVALGEKMDFIQVVEADERSHAILAEALRRGLPVCGHIYGRPFVAAYAASGVTDTHEAIDREIAADFLEAGMWVFLRGGPPTTPWHSLPHAIKAVTELGANPKRVCVCTDDRDADDLFVFGLDWVVRQAVRSGLEPFTAWSCGSLHPATRYSMDGELGGLGAARRADVVLLDDNLEPKNTWYGGQLVVQDRKPTPRLEQALERRYQYPKRSYQTVTVNPVQTLIPILPTDSVQVNFITLEGANIPTKHEPLGVDPAPDWASFLARENACFLTVVERHGKTGSAAFGLLKNFGLIDAAVGSSVGHDAHNIVIAGTNEPDMRLVLHFMQDSQGGICIVRAGQILASVRLPIAGLLSDARAGQVAGETTALKKVWNEVGCRLPYMGFNLLPLSVIPEIRLTDKGLVLCPAMKIVPLFEQVQTE